MIKSKLQSALSSDVPATSLTAKGKIEEMESRTSVDNPSDGDDGNDSEL
jgi:hypothetical protein